VCPLGEIRSSARPLKIGKIKKEKDNISTKKKIQRSHILMFGGKYVV